MKNIDQMSGPELVAAYNEIAAKHGVKTIKKFRDKPTGQMRLTNLINETRDKKGDEPKKKPVQNLKKASKELREKIKKSASSAKQSPKKTGGVGASPAAKKERKSYKRERQIIDMPLGTVPSLPRKGTLKARALFKLNEGCTLDDLVKMFEEDFKRRGVTPKTSARVRAREVILLLHTQNDIGFEEHDGQIFAIVE